MVINALIITILVVMVLFSIYVIYLIADCINSGCHTNYTLTGGNTLEDEVDIPKRFPQVGVLTNRILKQYKLNEFVVLAKTDGIHVNLAFLGNYMYSIKDGKLNKIKQFNDTFNYTILDGEYYEDTKKYYIFDACRVDGNDISNFNYKERMARAKSFVINHSKTLKDVIVKKYLKNIDLNEVINRVNSTEEEDKIRIDGAIFQLIHKPFFSPSPTCFKLKRTVMNTVDFKLKMDGENYKLYLVGKYNDLHYNCKTLPKLDDNNQHKENDDSIFEILFSSPYRENCHIFKPREKWSTDGYTKMNIQEINTLMKEIITHKQYYNDKIIEMSLANDGWVPMRVRNDKTHPNGYRVGVSNCGVMFSPVSTDAVYFEKSTAFGDDVITPYHDINGIIRKYIIEKDITPMNKLMSVLDLAGGRGADEENLYRSGAVNIFAVDNDREALVQYVSRTPNVSNPKEPFKFLDSSISSPNNLPDAITINAIQGYLSKNNDIIINEVKSRYEFPKNKFDVILMNYAIHYICYDDECLKALNKMINVLLSDDGLFIFSRFDGEKIRKDMTNGKLKLTTFELALIEKQMEGNGVWCKMALPTIDKTGYRAEPLVLDRYIDLLELETVHEYYPAVELEKEIIKIKNYKTVYDYLKYIKVTVMRKKK